MITSGADVGNFELRPQTIKGLLRFWWRVFQPFSGQELFEKESGIFGSSDEKYGSSKFFINVYYPDQNQLILEKKSRWPDQWGNGIKYILFSLYERKKCKNEIYLTRPIIKPGFEFVVKLLTSEDIIPQILTSFWLLSVFGGIGSRSRRGAGAFKIEDIKINEPGKNHVTEDFFNKKGIPLFNQKEENFRVYLEKMIIEYIMKTLWGIRRDKPGYSSYSIKGGSDIILFEAKNGGDALSILNELGLKIQEIRKIKPFVEAKTLHDNLNQYIKTSSISPPSIIFKKPASGLPIIYRFKEDFGNIKGNNLSLTYEVKGGYLDNDGTIKVGADRRASPLFISITEYKGRFYLVFLFLPAPFLPPGEKLLFLAKKEKSDIQEATFLADYKEDEFVRHIISEMRKYDKLKEIVK